LAVTRDDLGRGAWAFPLVGLAIGGALVACERGLPRLFPEPLVTFLLVTVWVGLTGGLHLDGLADTLDALGGGWGREESLAIMRDPRLGSYGAVGIVLSLLLIGGALIAADRIRPVALVLAPALGRLAPVLLARLCPPARADGLGVTFARGVTWTGLSGALLIALVPALGLLGWWGLVLVAWIFAVTAALASYFTRRLGGVTGDVMGGAVVGAELLALLFLVAFEQLGLR
jgi:adenosylcobinamide-GDP ribazoletransferase